MVSKAWAFRDVASRALGLRLRACWACRWPRRFASTCAEPRGDPKPNPMRMWLLDVHPRSSAPQSLLVAHSAAACALHAFSGCQASLARFGLAHRQVRGGGGCLAIPPGAYALDHYRPPLGSWGIIDGVLLCSVMIIGMPQAGSHRVPPRVIRISRPPPPPPLARLGLGTSNTACTRAETGIQFERGFEE